MTDDNKLKAVIGGLIVLYIATIIVQNVEIVVEDKDRKWTNDPLVENNLVPAKFIGAENDKNGNSFKLDVNGDNKADYIGRFIGENAQAKVDNFAKHIAKHQDTIRPLSDWYQTFDWLEYVHQ